MFSTQKSIAICHPDENNLKVLAAALKVNSLNVSVNNKNFYIVLECYPREPLEASQTLLQNGAGQPVSFCQSC